MRQLLGSDLSIGAGEIVEVARFEWWLSAQVTMEAGDHTLALSPGPVTAFGGN